MWNSKQIVVWKSYKAKNSQIDEVIIQANNQLGGFGDCLPERTRKFSMSCDKVKINDRFFPNTPYEPFWTGEKIIGQKLKVLLVS